MLAQTGLPLDPTPFTAWGILGILAFVIVILGVILYRLFVRQTSSMEARDKIIMDFVNQHRGETSTVMRELVDKVIASDERLGDVMRRQTRIVDDLVMQLRFLDQIERLKRAGMPLTQEEIDRVMRSVQHERARERD